MPATPYFSKRSAVLPTLFAAVMALGLAVPPAHAQRYAEDEVDKTLRSAGQSVKRYATSNAAEPVAEKKFRDYFQKYYFPAMTQASPEALEDLGNDRFRLFRDYIYPSVGAKQQFLVGQAYGFAGKVLSSSRYHPAVRYNALLILGLLDEKPGTPLARANTVLQRFAERAATDPRRPRYELAGALVGLQRHAKAVRELPREQAVKTARTLQKILTAEELAGQYESGVKAELYIMAAAGLADMKIAGPQGAFAAAIAQRSADESLDLESRATIASLLDRIPMDPDKVDGGPISKPVLAPALDVARQELDYATRFEDMMSIGLGRGVPAGRDAFAKRLQQAERGDVELKIDGMVALSANTLAAVKAVQPIGPDAEKEALAEVASAIADAALVATKEGSVDLDVTDAVKTMASRIEEVAVIEEPSEETGAEESVEASSADGSSAEEGPAAEQPASAAAPAAAPVAEEPVAEQPSAE